jgi:hypothetical protein
VGTGNTFPGTSTSNCKTTETCTCYTVTATDCGTPISCTQSCQCPEITPPPTSASPTIKIQTEKTGDTNDDGIINLIDLNKVISNFWQNLTGYKNADFDNNGKINIFDYNVLVNNYGK